MHAALLSVKTYKNALISGTATTAVVFLPMITLPGIMGKFLAYIPTTIFITLVASLFISLTITPALFFKLSKNKAEYQEDQESEDLLSTGEKLLLDEDREEKRKKTESSSGDTQNTETFDFRERLFPPILNRYEQKLTPLLATSKARIITIMIPLILFVLTTGFLSPRLGFLMMPAVDNEYLMLNLSAKEGTTTEELIAQTKEVETIL